MRHEKLRQAFQAAVGAAATSLLVGGCDLRMPMPTLERDASWMPADGRDPAPPDDAALTNETAAAQSTAFQSLNAQQNARRRAVENPSQAEAQDFGFDPETLRLQTLLDRDNVSPGVLDGLSGGNTDKALKIWAQAHDVAPDPKTARAALEQEHPGPILTTYVVTDADARGPYHDVPLTMQQQAEQSHLGYESAAEKIAEQFHMDIDLLQALNPGVQINQAGSTLLVIDVGKSGLTEEVAAIEVDKTMSVVRALAQDGRLLAAYPATVGSAANPAPTGEYAVRAIAPDPTYHFDPESLPAFEGEDVPDQPVTLPPGPNNPVGAVWIDLTIDSYGIHGTPEPAAIGKTASHGCVRLTNWDVQELAASVPKGTPVRFIG